MTNSLLRSGCPDDFLSLGENGQAVFDSAWQIRETLRLRKQHAVADALAIPQINDSGSRIDWYAPHTGQITSWMGASEEQRLTALRHLEHCQSNVNLLSSQCLHSEKMALRLFGSLLSKILQFPGSQYIYLVDDKPVITFWGFVNHNQAVLEDSLACLQVQPSYEPYPASVKGFEPDPPPSRIPGLTDTYSLDPELAEAPTEAVVAPSSRRRWIPTVAFLIVLACSGYLILQQPQQEQETIKMAEMVKPTANKSTGSVPVPETTLPLMLASVVPPVEAKIAEPVVSAAPPSKKALILAADEVKQGSTKFLNGTWKVRVQFSDPIVGKPPVLRYRINNNKGTVRLFNNDNIACSAQIYSGLHQSGTLMIKSRGNARCDDGSRHVLPEISCKSGTNGVAECTGRYEGDNQVPVTFQKESY